MTIILVIILILFVLDIFFWTFYLGIGPTPTATKVKKIVVKILPNQVNGAIFELGCGWGGLISLLQKNYPNNKIYAYEKSSLAFLWCYFIYGSCIYYKNFFSLDFKNAGLVVCYLCPKIMQKIELEILPNLPEGCWLISHTFRLANTKATKILFADDIYRTPIYLYRK